jgi:thymidylate synthase
VQDVIDRLNKDKYDRRALITGWNPSNISKLSLPCCHYSYQFLFIDYKLHLIWNQRSTDMVLGLPSDMLLAYFLLNYICDKTYLRPGSITMHLGSTHIYENHFAGVEEMLSNYSLPETHKLLLAGATNIGDLPNMIFVTDYQYNTINSKLEINV